MAGVAWSAWQRFAFRFGVIAAALMVSMHLFIFVPIPALTIALMRGWHWLSVQFGALLGLDVPPLEFTGSGDQLWHYLQLALCGLFAVIGALAWTLRARAVAYPRLAAICVVVLRYYLAGILIGYGMAKVLPMQFPPLYLARYDQAIGDMSPMGLLWSFMGHSQTYTWFAGAAEVVGSVLLLWRRTSVIGALILIAVMTNVVLLNFCYDVPVKLFSLQLLAMLFAVVLPDARRLLGAVLGYPAREAPPRTRGTPTAERVRLAIKLVMIVMIGLRAWGHYTFVDAIERMRTKSALHGIWRAERVVIDGVEHPPLLTDDARWHKLIFHEYGLVLRFTTDRRQYLRAEIDPKAHTITVLHGVLRVVWQYQRVDAEHLVVDTPHVHAELVIEPPPLLETRGFHWVQEAPFNR
ncbi:MAG TPA: hypothetical protein VIV40_32345 [Kofleriaceae bacterium]